jgi:hypothetical protein
MSSVSSDRPSSVQSNILNGKEHAVEVTSSPRGSEERLERFVHYPNTEELQKSTSKGCHFWGDADHNMKNGAYTYNTEDSERQQQRG